MADAVSLKALAHNTALMSAVGVKPIFGEENEFYLAHPNAVISYSPRDYFFLGTPLYQQTSRELNADVWPSTRSMMEPYTGVTRDMPISKRKIQDRVREEVSANVIFFDNRKQELAAARTDEDLLPHRQRLIGAVDDMRAKVQEVYRHEQAQSELSRLREFLHALAHDDEKPLEINQFADYLNNDNLLYILREVLMDPFETRGDLAPEMQADRVLQMARSTALEVYDALSAFGLEKPEDIDDNPELKADLRARASWDYGTLLKPGQYETMFLGSKDADIPSFTELKADMKKLFFARDSEQTNENGLPEPRYLTEDGQLNLSFRAFDGVRAYFGKCYGFDVADYEKNGEVRNPYNEDAVRAFMSMEYPQDKEAGLTEYFRTENAASAAIREHPVAQFLCGDAPEMPVALTESRYYGMSLAELKQNYKDYFSHYSDVFGVSVSQNGLMDGDGRPLSPLSWLSLQSRFEEAVQDRVREGGLAQIDPANIADYYQERIERGLTVLGYGVDPAIEGEDREVALENAIHEVAYGRPRVKAHSSSNENLQQIKALSEELKAARAQLREVENPEQASHLQQEITRIQGSIRDIRHEAITVRTDNISAWTPYEIGKYYDEKTDQYKRQFRWGMVDRIDPAEVERLADELQPYWEAEQEFMAKKKAQEHPSTSLKSEEWEAVTAAWEQTKLAYASRLVDYTRFKRADMVERAISNDVISLTTDYGGSAFLLEDIIKRRLIPEDMFLQEIQEDGSLRVALAALREEYTGTPMDIFDFSEKTVGEIAADVYEARRKMTKEGQKYGLEGEALTTWVNRQSYAGLLKSIPIKKELREELLLDEFRAIEGEIMNRLGVDSQEYDLFRQALEEAVQLNKLASVESVGHADPEDITGALLKQAIHNRFSAAGRSHEDASRFITDNREIMRYGAVLAGYQSHDAADVYTRSVCDLMEDVYARLVADYQRDINARSEALEASRGKTDPAVWQTEKKALDSDIAALKALPEKIMDNAHIEGGGGWIAREFVYKPLPAHVLVDLGERVSERLPSHLVEMGMGIISGAENTVLSVPGTSRHIHTSDQLILPIDISRMMDDPFLEEAFRKKKITAEGRGVRIHNGFMNADGKLNDSAYYGVVAQLVLGPELGYLLGNARQDQMRWSDLQAAPKFWEALKSDNRIEVRSGPSIVLLDDRFENRMVGATPDNIDITNFMQASRVYGFAARMSDQLASLGIPGDSVEEKLDTLEGIVRESLLQLDFKGHNLPQSLYQMKRSIMHDYIHESPHRHAEFTNPRGSTTGSDDSGHESLSMKGILSTVTDYDDLLAKVGEPDSFSLLKDDTTLSADDRKRILGELMIQVHNMDFGLTMLIGLDREERQEWAQTIEAVEGHFLQEDGPLKGRRFRDILQDTRHTAHDTYRLGGNNELLAGGPVRRITLTETMPGEDVLRAELANGPVGYDKDKDKGGFSIREWFQTEDRKDPGSRRGTPISTQPQDIEKYRNRILTRGYEKLAEHKGISVRELLDERLPQDLPSGYDSIFLKVDDAHDRNRFGWLLRDGDGQPIIKEKVGRYADMLVAREKFMESIDRSAGSFLLGGDYRVSEPAYVMTAGQRTAPGRAA